MTLTRAARYRTFTTLVVSNASNPFFTPDDQSTADIVRALAEPDASLDAVAKARGISVADLALWLTTPRARELMLTIERGGYTHVRMAASLNLSKAVAALLRVLDTFNALAASRPADDPLVVRAARHANKAAYHLYRLSRIDSIDDSRTHGMVAARARARADSSQRTASLSERAPSDASPPSQPVHPAGALHDLHPAPVLKTDADSPRAIEVGGSASTSMSSPASSSAASAPPSQPVHPAGALHDLHPTSSRKDDVDSLHPTSSLKHDVDALNVQLESLAHSLGIDISDLDDLDEMDDMPPLPPEFLATLPPELAALLTETAPPHASASTAAPEPHSASP